MPVQPVCRLVPGPRALQTCFRSARTDTHTRQHSELSLRPLRPLRPLPPSAASTALPPLPPLPLCRSQERLELCSAAVSLCRSGSAPLHCCCVHARTHTHARIASSLCPLCRLCPSAASAQGALPLCRSAALPLCRSAEPSRPCRFWHSRWGRFCRPPAPCRSCCSCRSRQRGGSARGRRSYRFSASH